MPWWDSVTTDSATGVGAPLPALARRVIGRRLCSFLLSQERIKGADGMGSSVYGVGYHQGSTDGYSSGFDDGTKHGGLIGVAVTVGVGLLISGGRWGYEELKKRRVAKHEQSLLTKDELLDSGEAGVSEDDRDE